MLDKKNKTFVGRVNGHSIYWSNRYAKKDAYRFIILKNGKQIYDTESLYSAIVVCLGGKIRDEWTITQKRKFYALAKEFDATELHLYKFEEKPVKYYAIKTEQGFIALGYNLTSKKQVVKLLKDFLQPYTEILNYHEMTMKDFLQYVRHQLAERYRIVSSETEFSWTLFEN